MILAALLLAASPVDTVVVSGVEARAPERQALSFEARCGERDLALNGVGLGSPTAGINLNGKSIALPVGAKAFLSEERAAYRVSARCPASPPAFQVRLYRVSGSSSGALAYSSYAFDVTMDGKVEDRGGAASNADTFWYR